MKHLVERQIKGLPLDDRVSVRVEYQLRARGSGRVVLAYEDKAKAVQEANNRNLHCFSVTTISERI
jgi:hypothetical protein